MRKSTIFSIFVTFNLVALLLIFMHAHFNSRNALSGISNKILIVERLKLTDLCIFTDARYTRNPSVADLHSPFQDGPMTMEHFPSGAIILPPAHLRNYGMDSETKIYH